jgi:nucleoside-diphosphate-sugar epimerase
LPAAIAWHRLDLLDADTATAVVARIKPSHLLNLAWYNVHGAYWRSPMNAAWVRASLALMEAFAEAEGTRFVGIGSCAEYDWSYGFLSELATPTRARTPFGRFKAALGDASGALAEVLGLSHAWGRVFFLYGPHENPSRLVASVIAALSKGEPVDTTHGRQLRDFSHVADIGEACVALLDSQVGGPVNLASGQPTAVRDIIEAVADIIGGRELVRFGARPLPADEPPLLVGDTRRLHDEVGFRPRYELEAGIRDTVQSFRDAAAHAS